MSSEFPSTSSIPTHSTTGAFERVASEDFEGKLRAINELHLLTSSPQAIKKSLGQTILLTIKAIWNRLATAIGLYKQAPKTFSQADLFARSQLKLGIHIGAEHMSHGEFRGNNWFRAAALGSVFFLDSLNITKESDLASIEKMTRAIKFYYQTALDISKATAWQILASTITTKLKSLPLGEAIAFPVLTSDHAMILYVEKTRGNTYKVCLTNTGGDQQYHHQKMEGDKQVYQTTYEIETATQAALCDSDFMQSLLSMKDKPLEKAGEYIYETLLPSLGQQAPPSTDPRLWSHTQLGGSCAATALKSLLRAHLDAHTYKDFEDHCRMEIILRSWTQIKQGSELFPKTQKIATLEVINQLERSLLRRGLTLSPATQETKRQLQDLLRTQEPSNLPKISTNLVNNLRNAFDILTTGVPKESLQKAQPYLNKARQQAESGCSLREFLQLQSTCSQLVQFCQDHALTIEQIAGLKQLADTIEKSTQSKVLSFLLTGDFRLFQKHINRLYTALQVEKKLGQLPSALS